MTAFHPVETLVHATPLIVLCSDAATGRPVTTGLRLSAVPLRRGGRSTGAFTTLSGAYAFENLPGLRDLEYGPPGVAGFGGSPAGGQEFLIFCEDGERRYLPFAVALTLPRERPFPAPLYAAPTTPPTAGLMLLRGSLTNANRPLPGGGFAPASHAAVFADYGTGGTANPFVALADARGQFALALPLPSPLLPPPGVPASPSLPAGVTIADLRWPLTLRFRYAPAAQRFLCRSQGGSVEIVTGQRPGVVDDTRFGWRCLPDIAALLTQRSATAIDGLSVLPTTSVSAEIAYVTEQIYRPPTPEGSVRLIPG